MGKIRCNSENGLGKAESVYHNPPVSPPSPVKWEIDLHGGDYDLEGPDWVVVRPGQ
jgi:hypothetical protein